MKVIDLLNKIANNEIKDGTKLKMLGEEFIYKKGYITLNTKTMSELYISQVMLNDEVEIIEEDKDIEKLLLMYPERFEFDCKIRGLIGIYNSNFEGIKQKIDELIREVNKLKNN